MPIKSTFQPYNLTKKQTARNTYRISQFFGVNYDRNQLSIGDSQATDMKNIVPKNGVLQKRMPFIQAYKDSLGTINGIYKIGNTTIFHINNKLYEATFTDDFLTTSFTQITGLTIQPAPNKSYGFVDKGRIYILDGESYKVLYKENNTWKLENVYNNKYTFVPMTTIGITENSSGLSTRAALDDANMLTSYRKNLIENPTALSNSNGEYVFNLDAKCKTPTFTNGENTDFFYIPQESFSSDNLSSILDYLSFNDTYTDDNDNTVYRVSFNSTTGVLTLNDNDSVSNVSIDGTTLNINYLNTTSLRLVNSANSITIGGSTVDIDNNTKFGIASGTQIVGYLDIASGETSSLHFNTNLNGIKEIIVKFEADVENNFNKIDKCSFGTIYNEQLFISGNSDYKNQDFHTESINTTFLNGDEPEKVSKFTYFSDLNYCAYGSDDEAIIGYDTYRDGDLIVFKEEKYNNATLYRRTKELKQAMDYAGNIISGSYEYYYPMYEINGFGGEGVLNHDCIANLMGSTIYLTKNGLKVLTSKETTYNNARYSADMSSYINPKLKEEIKSSNRCKLYAFKDKLFLLTSNNIYYANYTVSNDYELEWFPIDLGKNDLDENIFPYLMFEHNDELYFIDGILYRFKESDEYKDRKITLVNVVYCDTIDSEYFIIKDEYYDKLEEGVTLVSLRNDNDYAYYKDSENELRPLKDVYIKNKYENEGDFNPGTDDEMDTTCFILTYGGDDIKCTELYDKNGDRITNTTGHIKLEIYEDTPIKAFYITKPFNMGTTMYEKTIWGFTVVNDSGLNSRSDVTYLATRKESNVMAQLSATTMDLANYDFTSLSYENDGLPHIYTKYRVIPRVSFIKFGFKNEYINNMVLCELDILYSIPQTTRGSK